MKHISFSMMMPFIALGFATNAHANGCFTASARTGLEKAVPLVRDLSQVSGAMVFTNTDKPGFDESFEFTVAQGYQLRDVLFVVSDYGVDAFVEFVHPFTPGEVTNIRVALSESKAHALLAQKGVLSQLSEAACKSN